MKFKRHFTFLLLSFILSSITPSLSASDPRTSQAALICTNVTAPPSSRQSFISNFLAAMDSLTPQISSHQYATVAVRGESNDSVFAFGQCIKDLSKDDCDLCFATCKTQILRCLPFQEATRGGRNYLDGCYLRYDYYDFFGEAVSSGDRVVCSNESFFGDRGVFRKNTMELVGKLSSEAPGNGGFLAASVARGNLSVYGLGQCWETMNRSSCAKCLADASMNIGWCLPKREGRVLNVGCYVRYSTIQFYNNSTAEAGGKGGHRLSVILAVVSSAVAVVMIVLLIIFLVKKKVTQSRKVRKQLGSLANTVNKSSLNFKYETLEKATNYFSNSNKLGQGGSGTVFKGVLSDGKTVAVKRLFFNTKQWVDQFFNEVNLINGIDHKNLVKLLGCSITGPESLLVYEYVPNKSLHHYLSDSRNAKLLTWEMRHNIIIGAAEGLAYLHEESRLRIVHRDIKLSNVLLDENYTAKIADFGLARLFPEDKSHISTGIAGTLGYMAPEYIVRGKLTEKADVFSFGVLLIEVISGRKNYSQQHDPLSVVQTVWNLYSSSRMLEAVDPMLEGEFTAEKVTRVLHVGLLCAQAADELRPSMSMVVKMLSNDIVDLPPPTQPPFLSSNAEFGHKKPSCNPGSSSASSQYSMTLSTIDPR